MALISQGFQFEGWSWLAACRRARIPYAVLVQAALEHWWPADAELPGWREIYEDAAWVGFVSNANRELLESQLALRLRQAELVRNPFAVRYDARLGWPGTQHGVRLACVGRLQPSAKGQDLILQLLARERWRERPVHVTFAGSGPNEDGLKRLAAMLGVTRASFRGDITEVEQLWEDHHALILPSRYEGLPLVIVEAMLCSRACLVTRVAGNPELIENGVSGFIADGVNVPALDLAMEDLWRRRHDLQSMGAAARQAAERLVPRDPPAVLGARLLQLLKDLRGSRSG
jgi:glycosyltransferase involved in cell wall biosynthesis